MITAKLEQLIFEGNATYKTFVAGGSTKTVLDLEVNRWIIITDFIVYPFLPTNYPLSLENFNSSFQSGIITQMNIVSNKSFNSFVFRNSVNWNEINGSVYPSLSDPVRFDVYLPQEKSVAFNFLRAENDNGNTLTSTLTDFSDAESVGIKPPLDYGKLGMPGAITVPQIRDTGILPGEFRPAGNVIDNITNPSFTELSFPINAATDFKSECHEALQFPIVNVGYVELFGAGVGVMQPS